MGHYASEMSGPGYKSTPYQREQDREERRARRLFLWDLHTKYREQGEWVKEGVTISCPECTAVVELRDMEDHEDWHNNLARVASQADRASMWTTPLA